MKQPAKRLKDAGLLAARHYLALASDPRGRLRDEEKMLARLNRHVAKLCKAYSALNPTLHATEDMVLTELLNEARRRGPLTPQLGKDL